MSDSLNTVKQKSNTTPRKKPKGKLEETDLDLQEKADNYKRKKYILWVLAFCLMFIVIFLTIMSVIFIFKSEQFRNIILNKLAENIVIVVIYALTIFGITTNKFPNK